MENIDFSISDNLRNIKIPKRSKDLSEFLGIMFGDGYILKSKRHHKLAIGLNITEDLFYLDYVNTLIKKLFNTNTKPRFRYDQGQIEVEIESKAISQFLLRSGMPAGKKAYRLKIPKWISTNRKFITPFIRGLTDTDGSLFFAKRGTYKNNSYPVIEIKLHNNPEFIKDVSNHLRKIGLKTNNNHMKIQINGKENLNKWMKEINFKNPVHLTRYLIWKKLKYCPPQTNILSRLKILKLPTTYWEYNKSQN